MSVLRVSSLLCGATCLSLSFGGLQAKEAGTGNESGLANFTGKAESAKLGLEYRAEFLRSDNGSQKTKGKTPDATTSVQTTVAKLKVGGNFTSKSEYSLRFNLLNPTDSPLDYGYVTHAFNDSFSFSLGRMKLLQGGVDNLTNNFKSHAQGTYSKNFAFAKFTDMFTLQYKLLGKLQLQVFDDVVIQKEGDGRWNKSKHPTFALGWLGSLGPFEPLVSLATYDNQKSMWVDLGLKASLAKALVQVDVSQHSYNLRTLDAAGKAKGKKDTATTIALKVAYEISGLMTPSLYYSSYSRKQVDKDVKYNKTTDTGERKWDDNGTTYALAVDLHMLSKSITPHFALVGNSGRWQDSTNDNKVTALSEMIIKAGVMAEF